MRKERVADRIAWLVLTARNRDVISNCQCTRMQVLRNAGSVVVGVYLDTGETLAKRLFHPRTNTGVERLSSAEFVLNCVWINSLRRAALVFLEQQIRDTRDR